MPPPTNRQRPEQQNGETPAARRRQASAQRAEDEFRLTPEVDRTAAFLNNVGQGLSFGFSDELAAGAQAALVSPFSDKTFGEIFQEQLQIERDNLRASREQHPYLSTGGAITGAITTGYGLAKSGASLLSGGAQTIPRATGLGAAEGALYGTAYGLGSGEDLRDRAQQALRGGILGGVTGAITGAASGVLGRQTKAADTLEELRASARAAYQSSERIGLAVRHDAFRRFLGRAENHLRSRGFRETTTPQVRNVLDEFRVELDKGTDITLSMLDELRQVANKAVSGQGSKEDMLIYELINALDSFVGRLGSSNTSIGGVSLGRAATATGIGGSNAANIAGQRIQRDAAIDALAMARGMWARASKGQLIEDAVGRAADVAAKTKQPISQVLRNEFDKILRNRRLVRGFTEAERDAMRRVVRGDGLENFYSLVGKFDPSRGGFAAAMGVGVGSYVGGPVGMVALPAGGFLANRGANAIALRNAGLASELVRRGTPTMIQANPVATPTIMALASQPDLTEEQLRGRGNAMVDLLMRR